MISNYQTIERVVKNNLCMGCGVCSGICPKDAIQMGMDDHKGYFIPSINNSSCDNCGKMKNGKCVIVCPGIEVDFEKLGKHWLGGSNSTDILGYFIDTIYTHATDETVRYNSSSGGLVTALLCFALEKKLIDGAVVIQSDPSNPLLPKGILATTVDEIIEASGSKYCSTHIGEPLSDLLKQDGKYAIVGLPCHIHGIRKWEQFNPKLAEKIIYHFGLYCANNNTKFGTEYFLSKNNISSDHVKKITYRGNGWPGKLMVSLKNGEQKEIKRGTTEKSLIRKLNFSSSFHYDFQIPRCLTCVDLTAELADISFADPWNKRFLGKEKIGKSMLVIRSQIGLELIKLAKENGIIEVENANSEEVRNSQNITFKKSAPSRVWLHQLFGLPVPTYKGKTYPIFWSDALSYFKYIMTWLVPFRFTRIFLPIVQIVRWFCSSFIHIMKKYRNKLR